MAIPWITVGSEYVYFTGGWEVPMDHGHERHQNVHETQDGHLRCYDHVPAGSPIHRWKVRAVMDNSSANHYRFSDFLTFLQTHIVYSKVKFTYKDENGASNIVRLLSWGWKQLDADTWIVSLTMRTDFT